MGSATRARAGPRYDSSVLLQIELPNDVPEEVRARTAGQGSDGLPLEIRRTLHPRMGRPPPAGSRQLLWILSATHAYLGETLSLVRKLVKSTEPESDIWERPSDFF